MGDMRRQDQVDYDAGRDAGVAWIEGPALDSLAPEQVAALGANLGRVYHNASNRLHQDENADHAADAYAALTGDMECRSREAVRKFWSHILPRDIDDYSEDFYFGFIMGVTAVVCG